MRSTKPTRFLTTCRYGSSGAELSLVGSGKRAYLRVALAPPLSAYLGTIEGAKLVRLRDAITRHLDRRALTS